MTRSRRLRRVPSRLCALTLVVLGGILALHLSPHTITISKNPTIPDLIFQSRTVVLGVRITIIFAAGFIVASLFANIWSSQWLAKAGPFEVSATVVADLRDQLTNLEQQASEGAAELDSARNALNESNAQVERLTDLLITEQQREHDAALEIKALKEQLNPSD